MTHGNTKIKFSDAKQARDIYTTTRTSKENCTEWMQPSGITRYAVAEWRSTCNHNYLYRWLPCQYFILLMMGAWRPKHVEKVCSNKICALLHQVGVLFNLTRLNSRLHLFPAKILWLTSLPSSSSLYWIINKKAHSQCVCSATCRTSNTVLYCVSRSSIAKMEAAGSSKALILVYQTTQHHFQQCNLHEDSLLQSKG